MPVWLHHESNAFKRFLVYALFDEQSDVCFIKESIFNQSEIKDHKVHLKLVTSSARNTI